MNYTQAAGEKSTVKLTITFSEQEWQDALNKSYLRVRGKYSVPGFRKGKVPKPVLENFYGKGVLFEEGLNILYSQHYPEILEKEKANFTAVGEPSLNVEDLTEGKGVVLTAIVPRNRRRGRGSRLQKRRHRKHRLFGQRRRRKIPRRHRGRL